MKVKGKSLKEILVLGVAGVLAFLSALETVAGAGSAIIVFGELLRWWDLL